MSYGHSKKKNCCYQCQKRTVGCHAKCPDYAAETEQRMLENIEKKKFLHPVTASYFKNPNMLSTSAKYSKKRYR